MENSRKTVSPVLEASEGVIRKCPEYQSDDTDSSSSHDPADSPAVEKKRGRKKSSIIWNHCFTEYVDGGVVTYCRYCTRVRWKLNGSTSSALYHLKNHHSDKLTPEEKGIPALIPALRYQQTSPCDNIPALIPALKYQQTSPFDKIPALRYLPPSVRVSYVSGSFK